MNAFVIEIKRNTHHDLHTLLGRSGKLISNRDNPTYIFFRTEEKPYPFVGKTIHRDLFTCMVGERYNDMKGVQYSLESQVHLWYEVETWTSNSP